MRDKQVVSVARGDGIGPEIMEAVLEVLKAAKAPLQFEDVVVGQAAVDAVDAGEPSGVPVGALEAIASTGVLLKGPLETPQGGGFASVTMTLRKHFGLFANVRPCRAYAPYVTTFHPEMDIVIIRENEEDLYIGQEYIQTPNVVTATKLISKTGSERIVRYAFEYARACGRKKVTCLTKDNILKQSDGLFHEVFQAVSLEYPELVAEHLIVDIGMARVAHKPEEFDVIVLPNLYGDILSDIALELSGSVGLGGTANIGKNVAMFEAAHGSAPRLAGQDVANPSGLLLAAVSMLRYLGHAAIATEIHNAWMVTLEAGEHTADLYSPKNSSSKLGTQAFAQAVIQNLGKKPKILKASRDASLKASELEPAMPRTSLSLQGVDIFMYWEAPHAREALKDLIRQDIPDWVLSHVEGRGLVVHPSTGLWPASCDSWRCRFEPRPGLACDHSGIARLLTHLSRFGRGAYTQVQLIYSV